jgi:hypothetical protein
MHCGSISRAESFQEGMGVGRSSFELDSECRKQYNLNAGTYSRSISIMLSLYSKSCFALRTNLKHRRRAPRHRTGKPQLKIVEG